MQLTVPFCCTNTTITVRQPRSIEDREIGKQFVPLWKELADQLKVLSPDADDEVHSSSLRSMLAHKSSALKIAETGLENRFSNLLRLVADKRLHLLHLICLFLVFRLRCYNGFSLMPTGLMCDGRPIVSPLFSPPGGGPTFSLIRGVAMHESSSCSREDALGDYGRPSDPLSCLLFTALWLRCNQSLLWCRRLRRRRMLTSHVLSHSCLTMPHASH